MSRFGSFALGFVSGALTVVAVRRLREIELGEDVSSLSDSIQEQLEKLEARIDSRRAPGKKAAKRRSNGAG